jgi:hypothetical protein
MDFNGNNITARHAEFAPSCPSGGQYYACETGTKFVGCCEGSADPCKVMCPAGNLRTTSFDINYYGTFPDLSCESNSDPYSCTGTKPAFLGCCKSNPCATTDGCPASDLVPATWTRQDQFDAFSSHDHHEEEKSGGGSSTNVGAIAGGVVGGAVVLLIVIGIAIFVILRRRKRSKAAAVVQPENGAVGANGAAGAYAPHEKRDPAQSPPMTDGKSNTLFSSWVLERAD